MLFVNKKISRVELVHGKILDPSKNPHELRSLRAELLSAKETNHATRAVLWLITPNSPPNNICEFELEAAIPTPKGTVAFFGFNDPGRNFAKSDPTMEQQLLRRTLESPRRPIPANLDIIILPQTHAIASELAALYSTIYKSYPLSLDAHTLYEKLGSSLAFAVINDGRIVSVLFEELIHFEDVSLVELTHAATAPQVRGEGMTAALANRMKLEMDKSFSEVIFFAQSIPGPVMRSCHDFGMTHRGVLRNHVEIGIGGQVFDNLHVWSL